jgi:hypothetical protein
MKFPAAAFRGTRSGSSNGCVGRAVPDTPGRDAVAARIEVVGCGDPIRHDPAPLQVAGLGALPNPVVARAAVPDLLARQSWTGAFLLGATRLAVVPFHPRFVQMIKISAAGT